MEEQVLSIIEGIIESRNTFFARTIDRFRPASRDGAFNRFLTSETLLLELASRIYTNHIIPPNPSIVINVPANFMDGIANNFAEPVPVIPTSAQILQNVESIEIGIPATQMQCAICQDNILNTGSRIRQCGHTYHSDCLTSWLSMSVRCPVCRHDIREPVGNPTGPTRAGRRAGTSSGAE